MNIETIPLMTFVIVTTFTPGPNNISSASMGVLYGYKKTLNYLIGIASGFFLVMIACAYLSSALLTIMPVVEKYLRWLGACYILWLAIGTLRSNYSFSESNGGAKKVEYNVSPYTATFGLNNCSIKPFVKALAPPLDSENE